MFVCLCVCLCVYVFVSVLSKLFDGIAGWVGKQKLEDGGGSGSYGGKI